MPYLDIEAMKKEVDPAEIALLSLCDGLGRLGVDRELEKEKIKIFMTEYID